MLSGTLKEVKEMIGDKYSIIEKIYEQKSEQSSESIESTNREQD
jgi:hypothetical protein